MTLERSFREYGATAVDMHKTNDLSHDRDALEPLVDRTLRAAGLSIQEERKRLWADHQALRPTTKIPVCVYYEGIPAPQWEAMLGRDPLACRGELARSIELDLRRTLWMAEHVPDDHIVWPSIVVDAVKTRAEDWGVPLSWEGSHPGIDDPLEARRIVAPLADGIRVDRLAFSDIEVDPAGTRQRAEAARELTGGRLAVHVRWPDLGHSPFDIAARLCGLEALVDVVYRMSRAGQGADGFPFPQPPRAPRAPAARRQDQLPSRG